MSGFANSNTTLVKVKLKNGIGYDGLNTIQIQLLLKLNSLVIAYQSTSGEFKYNSC